MKNFAHKIQSYFKKLRPTRAKRSSNINSSSKHAYFFTHVPKTGGTTLIATLDRFFPVDRIFPHQLWWEVEDIEQVRNHNYNFFRGHFGGGAADLLTDKEIFYFTVLRNPVKLAYSTYQHVLRDKNTHVHDLVIRENMDFETFLSHPKTFHLASNRIVHNFCYGENNNIDKQGTVINNNSFKAIRKQLNPIHNGLTEEECFEKAIDFINNSKWFGILEHFNESLHLLCYTMVWPPVGQTAKLNRNKKTTEISQEAKKQAAKINNHDFQLYEYALKIFKNKYHKMLTELGFSTDSDNDNVSHLIDQYYQDNYLKIHDVGLKNEVYYTVADVILGSQWHQREWSINHQSYFCWSGPGNQSSIDFWVKPNNYDIKVKFINTVTKDYMDKLKIKINDQAVDWESYNKSSYQEIRINCHKRLVKSNGLLRIHFEGPTEKLAPSLLQSEDDREVGLALSAVTIKKAV
ncbi:sulfotransferase family protein [Marinicella gelatinilytica]|uniref:sulfotransferase family 2 domain-containing protein n=1 Tax=Marinicella gelatinilytica TaxID=2996017 RepID=UPI002260EA09|nr:sulfotransferase family 2 domain-containing protein [Marinicella gelatinilytica]MCX7544506.1 sulfotransferase family 2 domain-containing protein [Marinicella gelatinilytica]